MSYGRTLFLPRHALLCLYVYYANCSSLIEMGLFKPNWEINYIERQRLIKRKKYNDTTWHAAQTITISCICITRLFESATTVKVFSCLRNDRVQAELKSQHIQASKLHYSTADNSCEVRLAKFYLYLIYAPRRHVSNKASTLRTNVSIPTTGLREE